MRRRRRFLALLFIFSAFVTPLGFFYYTLINESRHESSAGPARPATSQEDQNEENHSTFQGFSKFSEEECSKFEVNIADSHPECLRKMDWIRNGWKTHKCYVDNHVDGSSCSFRYYLSQVEKYCPPLEQPFEKKETFAKMNLSSRRLQTILEVIPVYMKTRINRLWGKWKEGGHEVMEKYEKAMTNRRKLNVLVFIGFLANEKQLKMAKKSDHGGPLGELLQWSDLLATLSIIGHHLEVSTDKESLFIITHKYASRGPCQFVNGSRQQLDIIFTDIMGLNILRQRHRSFLNSNRCRIRLLDSFGTHAEFTSKSYFLKNKKALSGRISERNPWGGHGLDLRQHWTFYPHSHDNTFLGFVVDKKVDKKEEEKPIALVYGKLAYMWKDAQKSIDILKRHVEVHATVADLDTRNSSEVFRDVINHGFLNSDEISRLLSRTRIFFGLGFPLEGPAPLEAVAHGAVFINAKFREPKSRKNYRFLADKPTLREWTSQNPYMEAIGEPHVITVDIEDAVELDKAIRRALELKSFPLVPFEFQPAGMLLRVAMLLEKQELCDKQSTDNQWPPISSLITVRTRKPRDSCEMACLEKDLLCEPSFFPLINRYSVTVREFPDCSTVSSDSSPLAPFNCTLQSSASLFSCASRPSESSSPEVFRICPCRDYLPEQHAICKNCL